MHLLSSAKVARKSPSTAEPRTVGAITALHCSMMHRAADGRSSLLLVLVRVQASSVMRSWVVKCAMIVGRVRNSLQLICRSPLMPETVKL